MLFSNATVYQITRDCGLSKLLEENQLQERLKEFEFSPPTEQQLSKMGWVPPLYAHDGEAMYLRSENRLLFTLKTESKILPSAAIKKALDSKVKAAEKELDRKVGKKEKDQFKENVVQEMLTRALSKDAYLSGYISLDDNRLVVDTSSHARAEDFCALLRKTLGSLPIVPPQSERPADQIMTTWISSQENPSGFDVGESAKLISPLKDGAKITLKNQNLFTDEVLAHIEGGVSVVELALEARSLSFVINDNLQLKSINWCEGIKLSQEHLDSESAEDKFVTDFTLMSGVLDKTVSQLFDVMKVQVFWDGDDVS